MRKRVGVLLGALAVVVLVAATAQAGMRTQKVTTVTIAGWSSGPDEDKLVQQMADKFNATHKSIHVNWTVINGNYTQAMTARFAAHNSPDIFYVDSSVIGDWEHQGVIQPLNSYVTKSHFNTKKFYPKLLGAFKNGKTIYGFPKDWSPLATEINNTLSGKAGLHKARRRGRSSSPTHRPSSRRASSSTRSASRPTGRGWAPSCTRTAAR
jgi:ABC-type glycerol-3-phosphate transport system substrate-binding protein